MDNLIGGVIIISVCQVSIAALHINHWIFIEIRNDDGGVNFAAAAVAWIEYYFDYFSVVIHLKVSFWYKRRQQCWRWRVPHSLNFNRHFYNFISMVSARHSMRHCHPAGIESKRYTWQSLCYSSMRSAHTTAIFLGILILLLSRLFLAWTIFGGWNIWTNKQKK